MQRMDRERRAGGGGAPGGVGGYDPPEQAEPGETATASPADSALFPGAEQPGPQFDND